VSESFATGAVTGSSDVGGLVGENIGTVTGAYWDTQATGQSQSAGGIGLNTTQMQGASAAQNMDALDFTNTWRVMTNPPGYPELRSLPDGPDPEPPLTAGFTITPEDPTVGEQLTFDADPSTPESDIESYQWTLGDGTTATGEQVTHTYTDSGQFTVELTVQNGTETDTATKTVSVSPPADTFGIKSITPYVGGTAVEEYTHVEDLNTSLSYRVRVTQPSATANVTFELGSTTYTDTDGSDGWQFPVPTAQLTSDETLLVTAYGTDGTSAIDSISVPVIETPAWFDLLDPISRFEDRPIVELQAEFPSGGGSPIQLPNQFPFAGNVSLPVVGSSQSSDLTATVTVQVNLRTAEATVTVGGAADYSLSNRVDLSGGVSGSASLNLYEMDIRGGTLDAEVGAEITFPGIPNPPIPPVPPGAVNLYPIFGIDAAAEAQFDEVDSVNGTNPVAFELTEGSITPELYARQELGQKLPVAELVFGIEEGVNTTIPYPSFEPINGSAFAEVYLRAAAAGFEARVSFPPGDDRFSYQFGPLGGDTVPARTLPGTPARASTPTVEWQPVDRTGSAPPDRQLSAAGAATARDGPTPVVAPDAVAGNRITDNAVADKTPALAGLGSDESTLLWSQQQPNLSVLNGREILASTSTNGTSFGTPVALTNDTVSDYYPTITPTGGTTSEAVAAFTTFDKTFNESNVTDPGDIYPHGEIRIARLTETGWQSPTFLTNNTAFDFRPTVASHGDNWTTAWTRDGDGNLSTWSDRAVVYVRYNESGPVGPVRSVEQARSPRLTTVDGTTRLTYLDIASNATSGQLVIGSLQPGQSAPVEQASYSVRNLTDLTAANDTIVWTTTSGEPWAQVADTEGVRNLSAPAGLTPPQSVTLSSRPGRLLLNFRAARPDSSVAEAYYRPRVDGIWQSSRRYASGADANLTYWQATTAGTESGFTSVVAGKELDTAQKDDLFVFQSQFRPDLAVTVQNRSKNVTVGDEATLTVTVNNSGDISTNTTTLAVSNSSGTVATTSVPALQPGSSVERSLTATLDSSGQLRVTVDPNETIQEHSEANNQETVRFQPPDLTVINRTVTRLNGTIRVNATLGNPSSITAPAVTYRFENGPTQNRSGSVGALAPGATTGVSTTFDVSALSSRFPLTIRVDSTDSPTESNERNNTLVGPVKEPEIAVSAEQITYGRQNGTIVATVPIENTGTGGGEGTVQITGAESETVIATQSFEVGPAVRTASSIVNSTQVALPGVTPNETVILTASARPQENGSSAVVDRVTTTDTVTPPPVASFNVTITNTTEPVEGQALAVTTQITNTGAANGTQSVTLDAGGLGANSTTVTLADGATTTEVLTVATESGDAGTYTAQVASENDTASTDVRVDAPATFDVTLTSVDSAVTTGDSIGVTYEVTNTGDVQGTQNIRFEITETTEDTETDVTLNESETFSGQFSYITSDADTPAVSVTVSSEDTTASADVIVRGAPGLVVTNLTAPAAATIGDSLNFTATVTNTGTNSTTQQFNLTVNGTTVDTTTVSLDGGNATTVQLTWQTGAGDDGNATVRLSGGDAAATTNITVAPLTVADYADENGIVTTFGLFDAIEDWRQDLIETRLLLDVIDAWRSDQPV
jgi:PKD repeat protein